MKLVTYKGEGGDRLGVWEGDEIADLTGAGRPEFASMQALIEGGPAALEAARKAIAMAARVPYDYALLKAPIPVPQQLRDFMLFEKHVRQSARTRDVVEAMKRGASQERRQLSQAAEVQMR